MCVHSAICRLTQSGQFLFHLSINSQCIEHKPCVIHSIALAGKRLVFLSLLFSTIFFPPSPSLYHKHMHVMHDSTHKYFCLLSRLMIQKVMMLHIECIEYKKCCTQDFCDKLNSTGLAQFLRSCLVTLCFVKIWMWTSAC